MADKKTQERIKWLPLESNPDVINKVPYLLRTLLLSKSFKLISQQTVCQKHWNKHRQVRFPRCLRT